MAIIEIGPQKQGTHEHQLLIDGVEIEHCLVWESGPGRKDKQVSFYGYFYDEAFEPLRNVCVGELLGVVQSVVFRDVQSALFSREDWDHVGLSIELGRPLQTKRKELSLRN